MAQAIVGVVAGWFGGGALATVAAQLLVSVAFSALSRELAPKPKGQDLLRELQQPNALPVYRFVYGETRAAGTPAPVAVKGSVLYGCYILNSRPSVGPFTVLFDKREVEISGDPYNFAGAGAVATNEPFAGYVNYWIGRGDQVGPPAQILSEAGDIFDATDGWQGRTVLWVRLDAGASASRADRWPAAPPEVLVDGKWSRVWDPRDPLQDADDPATWDWSANHALCALDALRQNPFASYDDRNLWIETFEWAADRADAGISVKAGGTIPLNANGTLAFATGSELEDQVQPLLDAGAARWVRARGQLGVIPAVAQDIAMTITDLLGGAPARFTAHASRDSLATHAGGKFIAPDRAYELTDLPVYEVPGALAADGGLAQTIQPQFDMVTDHRQGQWLQAVAARQARRQRTLTAMVPPTAFDVVAGSWVTLSLPSPWTRRSGTYEVERLRPVFTDDEAGVTCQIEVTLREISAGLFAWTPLTDEQDVVAYDFDGGLQPIDPPGGIIATSGADVVLYQRGEAYPRLMFEFAPSASAAVTGYEWQWRVTGDDWTTGGTINAEVRNAASRVFGYLTQVSEQETYELRVRAVAPGRASDWVTDTAIAISTGIPRYEALFEDEVYKLSRVAVSRGTIFGLTRAGSATYIDASGVVQTAAADVLRFDHTGGVKALLVEGAATNSFQRSQDFDDAWWSKLRATITANAAVAPDTTTTADRLVDDTAAGPHSLFRANFAFTSGAVYAMSGFFKADTLGQFLMQMGNGGTPFPTAANWRAIFDLTTGSIVSHGANVVASMVALGGGWYRCGIVGTAQASANDTAFLAQLMSGGSTGYTGTGNGAIHVWGGQIEPDRITSYIPTTSAAASRAADVAEMRGLTAQLDLQITYGSGATGTVNNAPVTAGYWPTLSETRIRRLIGTP